MYRDAGGRFVAAGHWLSRPDAPAADDAGQHSAGVCECDGRTVRWASSGRAGIEKSFAKIAEEVRTQYTVGYYTHEPFIDGKYRKIEVKVLRPNLNVIAKKGYFPTASECAGLAR